MDDHEVEKFDLSVPHEQASFTNRTCQPQMLLYISSEFIDVYKEDDKRFRYELIHHLFSGSYSSWDKLLHVFFVHICQVFFDEERNAQEVRSKGVNSSIPSHSCLRVTRRIPIASQNDSLHNLNEVDSLNGKLAPKLNSPSEHFDTVDNSIPVYVAKGDESIRPMSNKACSSVEIARG